MIGNQETHNMEKRNYPRLEKSFPVRFNLAQLPSSLKTVTSNISEGGMMIRMKQREEISSLSSPLEREQNIEFSLPTTRASFKTKVQIVWIEKHSLGIKFVQLSTSQQERLSLFLKENLEETKPAPLVEVEPKTLIDEFIGEMKEEAERQRISTLSFGWFYTYVPEEIFYAAGFVPHRIMGKPRPIVKAKASLSGNLNPFVQTCLESALDGDYDSFAGFVIGNADDASRRLYDVWKKYLGSSFVHILDIPRTVTPAAVERYKLELSFLIKRLEEHFNIQITPNSLRKAIDLSNETRRLLSSLQFLRKEKKGLISSNQLLAISLVSMKVSKGLFNLRLRTLLEKLESMSLEEDFSSERLVLERKPRILLTGSFYDSPALANIIEDSGGSLVCEDICTTLRYFTGLADATLDEPILALAKRYLNKAPGARSIDQKRRFAYIDSLIRDYEIDGVIYYVLKFDDSCLFEYPDMREWLQARNIPVLLLESDHRFATVGQFVTRIQAFLETLALRLDM